MCILKISKKYLFWIWIFIKLCLIDPSWDESREWCFQNEVSLCVTHEFFGTVLIYLVATIFIRVWYITWFNHTIWKVNFRSKTMIWSWCDDRTRPSTIPTLNDDSSIILVNMIIVWDNALTNNTSEIVT